nr:putative mitochondrial protein [Tanacetum cinerariifolium]
ITTPAQMKWLPKLIGFDYEVTYKKGKDNVVADALLRKEGNNPAKVQAMQSWITTPAQMKWLPKLIGFDYEVTYKKGKDNVVADALLRKEGNSECFSLNTTSITTELYDKVKQTWTTDDKLKAICDKLYGMARQKTLCLGQ